MENEADIPAAYWKPQPPKLDRTPLTKALHDGEKVKGAGGMEKYGTRDLAPGRGWRVRGSEPRAIRL